MSRIPSSYKGWHRLLPAPPLEHGFHPSANRPTSKQAKVDARPQQGGELQWQLVSTEMMICPPARMTLVLESSDTSFPDMTNASRNSSRFVQEARAPQGVCHGPRLPMWNGGGSLANWSRGASGRWSEDAWSRGPEGQRWNILKALQGLWVNIDCPNERYIVVGQNVTRTDAQGSRYFTLQWDWQRKQLQWGTQGRLSLTWLNEGQVAWTPSRTDARCWRWQRAVPPPPPSGHTFLGHGGWRGPYGPSCAAFPSTAGVRQAGAQHPMIADRAFGPSSYGPWRRSSGCHRGRTSPYSYHQDLGFGQSRRPYGGGGSRNGAGGNESRLPCGLLPSEVFDLLFREITPDDYETLCRLDETIAKPTASAKSLEDLLTISGDDVLGEDCTVCLTAFEKEDEVATLPCRHNFHRACITKWMSKCRGSCPLCGVDLSDQRDGEQRDVVLSPGSEASSSGSSTDGMSTGTTPVRPPPPPPPVHW